MMPLKQAEGLIIREYKQGCYVSVELFYIEGFGCFKSVKSNKNMSAYLLKVCRHSNADYLPYVVFC